jgi:hypothetical protein
MLKKVLIIAILFFVIAVGITGYMLFYRNSPHKKGELTDGTTSPFGGNPGDRVLPTTETTPTQNQAVNIRIPITDLMNLSPDPVVGSVAFTRGGTPYVRYNLRATGHVLEVNLITGTSSKISNKTIPKLQQAFWMPDGKQTFIQYLDNSESSITTYYSEFKQGTTSSDTYIEEGGFFRPNISSLAVAPDAKKIFSLIDNQYGGFGIITDKKDENSHELFISPLHEWIAEWPEANTITITTKPASSVGGYMYFLNAKTGAQRKIIGNVIGLTTLTNPTAQKILYTDASLALRLLDVATQTSVALPAQTLPEKCVWSKKQKNIIYCAIPSTIPYSSYPEDWYQGKVGFSDNIYSIDTSKGTYTSLAQLDSTYKKSIDVTNMSISSNEDYLIFSNKKDGTLWSLKLSQP